LAAIDMRRVGIIICTSILYLFIQYKAFLTANENFIRQAHAPEINTLPDSESSIKPFVQIMRIAAGLYRKNEMICQFKAMPNEKNPQWNIPTKIGKNYIKTNKRQQK